MKIIKDIIKMKQLTPIVEIKWEEAESVGSSKIGKCDSVDDKNGMNQEDPKNDNFGNNGQDSDLMRCDRYTDLENSTIEQVRASKRLKRPPTNKKNYFYSRRKVCNR
jgi:hypothetical protein